MVKSTQSFGFWHDGIVLVRIAIGVLLISQGWQLFDNTEADAFLSALSTLPTGWPDAVAYTAMAIELLGGLFLILGLFTRAMAAMLFTSFMMVTFMLGEGKIFSDNQLPFLYALACLVFFFAGAGRISIDFILFVNRKEDSQDGISSKGFGRYVSRS